MPNALTSTGLTVQTKAELVAYLTAKYQFIYGADINLDSDSPDGQMMNIFIQAILDQQDLLVAVYNSFDPDKAFGVVLDSRVAYNGIQRQAGTYTTTNLTLTITQALTLYGLDQSSNAPFTVSDNAGNQWQLAQSIAIPTVGTYVLLFRSAKPGAVLTVPNSITTPVSVVLGVTAINNPTTYAVLGLNEESDVALKIRRQRSVALSSQGYADGLLAALKNISGMSSAFVYENNTGSTDADGIPSHSIWVIVSGSAADLEIANAIYRKRNAGAGMRGAVTYPVPQADGSYFITRWDVVAPETLYIKFTATSLDGVNPPNIAAIRAGLVTTFVPGVAEKVNINTLSQAVRAIDPNTLVTNAGFSTTLGGTYTATLSPSAKNKQLVTSAAQIIITPIVISPMSLTMSAGGATKTFTATGGYGTYTWSKTSGNGSINSSTGVFTSGASGTTVIRVTDSSANYTEATITAV